MHRTKLRSGAKINVIGDSEDLPPCGVYRIKGVSERQGNFVYTLTLIAGNTVHTHFATDIDFYIGKTGSNRVEITHD